MSRARTRRRRHVEVEQPQRRQKRGQAVKNGPFLLVLTGATALMTWWLDSKSTSAPEDGGLLALAVGSGLICVIVVGAIALFARS